MLYQWSFAGRVDADDETLEGHEWLTANSLSLTDMQDASIMRQCLDTIAITLDGRPAAQTTVARKRAVFYGALRYAVELGRLQGHPIDHVQWRAPRTTDELDRRVVINPTQAARLLAAVRKIDPAMEGFFACMYYAAMRPGEVLHLRRDHCTLPPTGWGELLLTGSTQRTGLTWGDGSSTMEDRELKHRSQKATRPVPACPELVAILDNHLTTYGTGHDGRLFVTRAGEARTPLPGSMARPVSGSSYGNTWRKAREAALTPREAASPMARRPYDLRHACVSLWLNAGVPAAQVAEWAGHSVAVLLRVYAQCLDGQGEAARLRIETALAQTHPDTTARR